ncbi:hypothetical protein CPB84DRAFT_1791015 [Gymnopilus junonius]|uniref:Uncharacterized protein n=1 Tax=Gymnopilus junonius TaxID=109634 RepID=A0A9P5NDT3_GYMJU|nr:hypothetical protein CPB84DRAFT_1793265 [Gymnopilus junonius]KAF8882324.1 hypothetical protein CPB84DRAFT_1791015 [Gymnopilus junonius]
MFFTPHSQVTFKKRPRHQHPQHSRLRTNPPHLHSLMKGHSGAWKMRRSRKCARAHGWLDRPLKLTTLKLWKLGRTRICEGEGDGDDGAAAEEEEVEDGQREEVEAEALRRALEGVPKTSMLRLTACRREQSRVAARTTDRESDDPTPPALLTNSVIDHHRSSNIIVKKRAERGILSSTMAGSMKGRVFMFNLKQG